MYHLLSSFFFIQIAKSAVHSPDTVRNGTVTKSNAIDFAFSRYCVKCGGILIVTEMI